MSTVSEPTQRETLESVVIRFCGDSGDGMQQAGAQFTQTTALAGNDLATFPDFPAEIRAPTGTTYGVSGFQIHFSSGDIRTPGDEPDVLVAMNPAALKVNLSALRPGGLVIVNTGEFKPANLKKAGYAEDPLTDGSMEGYRVLEVDINRLTLQAVEEAAPGMGTRDALRCKNYWTLGLLYWMYDRDRAPTLEYINKKFGKRPEVAAANVSALNAGHVYAETAELPSGVHRYVVPAAKLPAGEYRNVTGNEATAWGLAAGAKLAQREMVLGSYPITPASTVLHYLAGMRQFGVTTFQAEDEIAAVCAAIGASYAGKVGVTTTSGPGLALKTEAMGLAIMTELPLVVVDVQRAGPSTGMPTKTEQSDLLFALFGRNGDAPIPVLAAATPADCFDLAIEAVRIATQSMIPVLLLTDGYIANGSEPWKIPSMSDYTPFPVSSDIEREGFHPYLRDETTLARPWAVPGMAGLEHRIGGIEKGANSGNISYDPTNHEVMTKLRADKVARVANTIPDQAIELGEAGDDLVLVSWGSPYGAVYEAVRRARGQGKKVAHVHLRYLNPLPKNLAALLRSFGRVVVPELNNGQLARYLRGEYLIDAQSLAKVAGQPFKISELSTAIDAHLDAALSARKDA